VVVALRRSVAITGSPTQICRIAAVHAGDGPGASVIGGFAFQPGRSRTAGADGGGTFVLQDNRDTPYVIGIGINVLGAALPDIAGGGNSADMRRLSGRGI